MSFTNAIRSSHQLLFHRSLATKFVRRDVGKVKIRLSTIKDMPRIQKLISEDFLANEPLAKLMQLEAGDCKVYFDTLFKHPFTIDHSICAVDESNKVIGCAVLTLNSTLPHLQKYNFNKDANADETVGSDDVSSKFRAILKETKRHVLARKPKEFHTIMRHEMSSVPPQYGGNNIATRMSIEGLQLIKEKIKELQFSYGEATNEISWRVRSKAKFQVASKLKYEDFGIEVGAGNINKTVYGIYKMY